MTTEIKIRRDTAANWTAEDPTLAAGEMGWETDTNALKIGDGATAWTALDYFEPGAAALDDLSDVDLTGAANGDVLTRVAGVWEPATPVSGVGGHVEAKRVAGDISLVATAITAVDTGLDLVLPAAVGDLIGYGVSGIYGSTAQTVGMDVYTMVAGARVNPFGDGLSASLATVQGVAGWHAPSSSTAAVPISGEMKRVLAGGDISGGNVTLRLHYAKLNATARALLANAALSLHVWATNYGQA